MGTFKDRIMYRSDGGQVSAVENMAVSHLINAIGHHNRQIDTLDQLVKDYNGDLGYINARRSDLGATVEILEAELIERNPDDDPERHPSAERDW